jgi:hypothetical protein
VYYVVTERLVEGLRISGSFEKRLSSGHGNTSEKEAVHENPTASSSKNVFYKVKRLLHATRLAQINLSCKLYIA